MSWMIVIGLASWPLASLLVGLALGRAIGLRGDDTRAVPPLGPDVQLRRLRVVPLPRDLVG